MLVLGDIQGAAMADDVPPAARKALVDMREFLPFKSFKLLDAAWVMCCGQQGSNAPTDRRPAAQTGWNASTQTLSQVLRGPEEQEYELKLMTSRAEGGQVFVRFSLFGGGTSREAGAEALSAAAVSRTTARRIADLKDRRSLLLSQIQDLKKKVELGTVPPTDIPKLEVELRQIDREIDDLNARMAEGPAARSAARAGVEPAPRSAIIDTSFTMNVGETVVVGHVAAQGRQPGADRAADGGAAARDDGAERVGSGLKAQGSRKNLRSQPRRLGSASSCLSPEP